MTEHDISPFDDEAREVAVASDPIVGERLRDRLWAKAVATGWMSLINARHYGAPPGYRIGGHHRGMAVQGIYAVEILADEPVWNRS